MRGHRTQFASLIRRKRVREKNVALEMKEEEVVLRPR